MEICMNLNKQHILYTWTAPELSAYQGVQKEGDNEKT